MRKASSKGGKAATSPREAAPPVPLAIAIPVAAVSGCLVFLSYPSYNLFPLQWVSLVPLLWVARGRSFGGGFFLGFVAGWATNIGGFHWIADLLREFGHMGPAPSIGLMVLVAAYQALVFAFATGFSAWVVRRLSWPWFAVFPPFFTAVEYAIPFIFPWYFANGQQPFHASTQIVEITGVSGLTYLIVLFNAGIAEVVQSRIERRPFPWWTAIAAVLFVANVIHGHVRIGQVDAAVEAARKFKVGIVEANVGIWEKEAKLPDGSPMQTADQLRMLYGNLLKHQFLSAALERESRPDLLVWPESSYIPFTEVYSKTTDITALAASGGGKVVALGDGGLREGPPEGASGLRVTGVNGLASAHEGLTLAVGQRGAVFRFDGASWTREQTGIDRDLLAVAVDPDGDAVAAGAQGALIVRRGGAWHQAESGTTADLRGAAWAGAAGFVACGDRGTVRLWNGKDAIGLASGTDADLLAIAASPDEGVVAVGDRGTMVRIKRGEPRLIDTPTRAALRGVTGVSPAWVVGDGGLVLRCGDACKRVAAPARNDLYAIASDPRGDAFAVGAKGTFLKVAGGTVTDISRGEGPDLRSVTFVHFREGYPLPHDVRSIYASPLPLPKGDAAHPVEAVDADSRTPERDRNAAIRGFSTPLLFGAITMTDRPGFQGEHDFYNTALLVSPDGKVLGRYDKNYPLIFGEYLPFADTFPFLRRWFPEAGEYKAGTEVEVFDIGDVRVGVMICYEDIIPSFTRRLAGKDPNFLVNITNDAWFGKTSEPYLHLELAVFRAIENRIYLLRSTNTGVSAIVDPVGRIVAETELDNPDTLVADVALLSGDTIYRKVGDVFAWAACASTLALVFFAIFKRGRSTGKDRKRTPTR